LRDRDHYFAYGSNLKAVRILERVPSAQPLARARLANHALRFDKPGADGSGKANLCDAPGETVWGFVYTLERVDWPGLDACEPGYDRISVEVVLESERRAAVQTYRHPAPQPGLVPLDGYVRLVVEGAREHALPAAYVGAIAALASSVAPGD